MGEFGLNLCKSVELQVGILQNFVLATAVSAETARTTVTAHSKHIFCNKAFTMLVFLQTLNTFQWVGLGYAWLLFSKIKSSGRDLCGRIE